MDVLWFRTYNAAVELELSGRLVQLWGVLETIDRDQSKDEMIQIPYDANEEGVPMTGRVFTRRNTCRHMKF